MAANVMRMPQEVRATALQKYRRYRREWLLQNCRGEVFEPLEFVIGTPTQEAAAQSIVRLQEWIRAWKVLKAEDTEVVWKTVSWHRLGGQRTVPDRIRFLTPQALALFADPREKTHQAFERAMARVHLVKQFSEPAALAACGLNAVLFDYDDPAFERFCKVVRWLAEHPKANCYVRELPIEGVDTKWLETHIGTLASVLDAMMPSVEVTAKNLEALWGLKRPSPLIRLRGLEDFIEGVPVDAQMALSAQALNSITSCKNVLIVENLQTALSLKRPSGVLVIMGLGFGVQKLESVQWLHNAKIRYFGDLDAHGMAILSLVRSRYPDVRAVLMDRQTLENHRPLIVKGPDVSFEEASYLNHEEKALFDLLVQNHWRLEQERIPIDLVNARVEEAF